MEDARCVVKLGWLWIDSASFRYVSPILCSMRMLMPRGIAYMSIPSRSHFKPSLSSLWAGLQTTVSVSSATYAYLTNAHYPPAPHRKKLLLAFAALGSISAILFLLVPSTSPAWPLIAPLAVCANVGFGASIVALNAYIPTLAQGAQEVIEARANLARHTRSADLPAVPHDSADTASEADEPLLAQTSDEDSARAAKAEHDKILSTTTSRISSQGIALGYASGIVMLLLALIPVRAMKGSTDALRLAIGLSGIWWAVFSLPAAVWLPGAATIANATHSLEEDGDNVPPRAAGDEQKWSMTREIARAWRRLGQMLRWREIKKLRNTFTYLAAWFLLSDGLSSFLSLSSCSADNLV